MYLSIIDLGWIVFTAFCIGYFWHKYSQEAEERKKPEQKLTPKRKESRAELEKKYYRRLQQAKANPKPKTQNSPGMGGHNYCGRFKQD